MEAIRAGRLLFFFIAELFVSEIHNVLGKELLKNIPKKCGHFKNNKITRQHKTDWLDGWVGDGYREGLAFFTLKHGYSLYGISRPASEV